MYNSYKVEKLCIFYEYISDFYKRYEYSFKLKKMRGYYKIKKGGDGMSVNLDTRYLSKFIKPFELDQISPFVKTAHDILHSGKGAGSEFTGWLNLPQNYDKFEFEEIKAAAEKIRKNSDILLVIGIGGSYLGARAVIEFLKSNNYNALPKSTPDIYFVGNNMSTTYINDILRICENKEVSINVISKSGTTTEPAIAFRIFRKFLEDKYGKDKAKERIFCTTDKSKGALKKLADKEGYKTFTVPDDIGGRYSVLTAVGLLPIAVAGINIDKLMYGAKLAQSELSNENLDENDCYKYAAIRHILYNKGKEIEVLESYEPSFMMFSEWYKQLFGESEGKDQKGILPISLTLSTDLHSMGQFIQSGRRNMFETVLLVESQDNDIVIGEENGNADSLNYLSGKTVSFINRQAALGTILAHTDGDVPNVVLKIKERSEEELGYLIYFFEKACAISGYMLGVNPFDQPGVENYKKNMFALLGKPGFEEKRDEILNKFND